MADQQKKLVRRGGGGGGPSAMTIEEPPPSGGGSSETDEFLSSAGAITGATNASAVGIAPRDVATDLSSSASAAASAAGKSGPPHPTAQQSQLAVQPLSIDERYEAERQTAKVRHWRDSPHAVGLVEVSWRDELGKHRYADDDDDVNGPNRGVCADCCREEIEPTCGCLYLSGLVCSRLGAGRVGNMVVLKESTVLVEVDKVDPSSSEDGNNDEEEQISSEHGPSSRRGSKVRRTKIDLVVGPYWPMLLCVTYPLILGISGWTAATAIPGKHPFLVLVWGLLTFGLIYSLFNVGFRDPGILPRYRDIPPGVQRGDWRWNDQAQTYRPRGAIYDADCAVVIEEFDHTCPWTGTAIGKSNMPPFQAFVALVFICLIMDILLLTKAF